MGEEWSTFMDGSDCHECQCYEKEEKRLKERIRELEAVQINFPQIFYAVRWLCENINTELVDTSDSKEIKELADRCHAEYLKET